MIISPQPVDSRGNPQATGATSIVGRDDFLKMFVSKLKYQDPLNPMEDGEFIAQLAQFTSLEQLTNINDNLEANIQLTALNSQTINNSVAAQLIGKEIVADVSEIFLSEGINPRIGFELQDYAADVTIDIIDGRGNVVRSIRKSDLPAGINSVRWDGNNDEGDPAAPGNYSVKISATTPEGTSFQASLSVIGTVNGVVYRGGMAYLQIDGAEVALGDVREIHAAN